MMAPMILRCCLLLLTFFFATILPAYADSKNKLTVVATIRPLHSILSSILQGVSEPRLLLDQNQSPHHFSLRPSQRSLLAHANIVFWVGEELEAFMPRVIKSLPKNVKTVALINSPGLKLLKLRKHHDKETAHEHHPGNTDPHIWLSVDNTIELAKGMSDILALQIPEKRHSIETNLKKLVTKLNDLKTQLNNTFNKRDFSYLVYHDAYQYFENDMNVSPLAAISDDEEQAPGIRHLRYINQLLASRPVSCIIINTLQQPPIVKNLVASSRLIKVYLEPLGQQFSPGPELYFRLMNTIAGGYRQCSRINNSDS